MKLLRLLGAIGTVLCLGIVAHAQTEVKITGQIRLRHESEDKDIRPRTHQDAYSFLRTRAMVEGITAGNTHIVIQFQESRQLADGGNSGWTQNAANVEIHQAYIRVDRMFLDGLGLRVGRFEFNLGNQRVFGASDWNNYGRAWEGGEVFYENPTAKWSGFWLEWYRNGSGQDGDIYGITSSIKPLGAEFTAFYLHDELGYASLTNSWTRSRLRLSHIGTYWKRQHGQLDFELNGGYQFGEKMPLYPSPGRTLNISAGLVTLETGYTVPGSAKARLAAGIDATSGDGDGSDNDWHAYDNLFYSAHPFRGYMDYFVKSEVYGLIDLLGRSHVILFPGLTLSGDVHYFLRAEKYVDFTNKATRRVGTEIDLGMITNRVPGADFAFGASVFQPTESFAGFRDPDIRWWWYGMLTANF